MSTKEARQADRFAQFAVAVADMALEDAGELDADPGRSGVIMGTGVGGLETLETQILIFGEKGARRVSPRLVPMMMSNAGAAAVSIRLGWHGPSETITTACAAGAHSIGHAARLVASGRCDVAIGGAAEAGMTGVGMAAFANMTALSTSGDLAALRHPPGRLRDHRGGRRPGPRGWDHAVARGAHIYGELAGSASTADAHHITAPIPGGSGAAACMTLAMEDAGVAPDRDRPHQRPRHLHPAQRPGRVRRHHQGVRRHLAPGDLDQGDHRARARAPAGPSRRWPWSRASSTGSSPRPPGTSSPTPTSTSTSWPGRPGRGSRARSCPTPSGSGATTAAW